MKANEIFLKVIKDKSLSSLCIFDRIENNERKQYMQVSIKVRNKYQPEIKDSQFFYTDTFIRYEDYSGTNLVKKAIDNGRLKFSAMFSSYQPHLFTFLKAIKKDSEISFKIVAFNSCDNWQKVNFVSHQIYGIIDDKFYLLESYVGPDNFASPIQY